MNCTKIKKPQHRLAKKSSWQKLSKRTRCCLYKRYRRKKKLRSLKRAPRTLIKVIITPQTPVITDPHEPNHPTAPPLNFSVIPYAKVHRYFYLVHEHVHLSNPLIIPAHLFINDNGQATDQLVFDSPNGYMNLYINAVIQQEGIYSVTNNELTIQPTGQTIHAGTVIIIESVVFSSKVVPMNLP